MSNDRLLSRMSKAEITIRAFENHCETLAMGLPIPISDGNGGVIFLNNFEELSQKFSDLDVTVKNQMKQKYQV